MQNLGRFYTTSNFDCEYIQSESRYPKSKRHVIENDCSRIWQKKSGKLCSTIKKVTVMHVDPPKLTFSGDYIVYMWYTPE